MFNPNVMTQPIQLQFFAQYNLGKGKVSSTYDPRIVPLALKPIF